MAYSDKVLDHYNNPRNVGSARQEATRSVGTGMVGAPECGDVMKLQIKVNPDTGIIEDAKFKTFGCGSAIASSSLATEMLKGKTVDEALEIKNTEIVNELSLPPVKIHCSVLAEDAIKAAIDDYKKKQVGQPNAAQRRPGVSWNCDGKCKACPRFTSHRKPCRRSAMPSPSRASRAELASRRARAAAARA